MMKDFSQYLIEDGYIIYLFHGVIPVQRHQVRNYTKKHLTVEEFSNQIQSLCKSGVPVSMQDIVDATFQKKALPPNAFAITFDDGFENNYTVAAPVLERYDVPAMMYVTTGFIEHNTSSWIDQIEYAFEELPAFTYQNPFDKTKSYTCIDAVSKIEALCEIRRFVKHDSTIDPLDFAKKSLQQLGVDQLVVDHDLDQKMSWKQIQELDQHPLFTIGGHTHTHPILSFLTNEDLRFELDTSIRLLSSTLNRGIDHYSYPEGLAHCYNRNVVNELKTRGVVCSPSAVNGVNHIGDSLFDLKRIMVE